MYARIQNNQIVEWPVLNIRNRFPNTSFPAVIQPSDLPENWVTVAVAAPPTTGWWQQAQLQQPQLVDGVWQQTWVVVDRDPAELEQITQDQAHSLREQRNQHLRDSDWTQLADAPVDRLAWAQYRQALRDISDQPGWPWQVTWPSEPQ